MIFASFIIILASAAAAVSIEAAARGRLGVNSLIGLRISSVMSSDEAWQRGHAAARIPVWLASGGATVAAIVSIALPVGAREIAQTISTVILLLGVTIGGIIAHRVARTVIPPVFDDTHSTDPSDK